MTHGNVQIRELAAWGFDDYPYRSSLPGSAPRLTAQRSPFQPSNIVLADKTAEVAHLLLPHSQRTDLLEEMAGLQWSLGVIDLRSLLAFQRRLSFNPALNRIAPPAAHDWPALIDLCFGPTKFPDCTSRHDTTANTLTLESTNPNLHIRTSNNPATPLTLHAGGPFLEVALFRNRWFLRDGYHRAYALLRAGIHTVPAVIVQVRNLTELGVTQPWFFSEDILFSSHPPYVADFLNDALVLEYERPPLLKTIRIIIEESLTPNPLPATTKGEQP